MSGWEALPDGVGTVLAVSGELRVAAQLGRLRAWRGFAPLWSVPVDEPNPARPALLPDGVRWGPYAVSVDGGAVTPLPLARVPAGYLPTAHAWSPDGSVAVAAGRRADPGGSSPPSAAWLLGGAGPGPVTLWSGHDVPPVAVLVAPPFVVVGHRHPDVFSMDGTLLRSLDGVTSPQRLDGQAGRLLVVEAGLLSVWELESGSLVGRLPGTWVDACLTPDGSTVLAADMAGALWRRRAADLQDGAEVAADGPVMAVATDGDVVLAAFARPPGLRMRPL